MIFYVTLKEHVLLLHLVDLTSEDPIADYHIIQEELKAYGRGLGDRPQIIALNKLDAVEETTVEEFKNRLISITNNPILLISAVARTGLEELKQLVWQKLEPVEEDGIFF